MRLYARIQDGVVAELLATDGDITTMFNPALLWVDISSRPEISAGWQLDGTEFIAPSPAPPAAPPLTIAELQAQIAQLSAQLTALSRRD
jgi:hypothetical protein